MRSNRTDACLRCKQIRRMHGRGLCASCYESETNAGRIDTWALERQSTQEVIAEHLNSGMTYRELGDMLGMTREAVKSAAVRLKAKAPKSDAVDMVQAINVEDPPERPACAGSNPSLFDIYTNRSIFDPDGRPATWVATQVNDALAYCARCPLATRTWCVDVAVTPQAVEASIIAGGVVWVRGVNRWDIERNDARVAGAA